MKTAIDRERIRLSYISLVIGVSLFVLKYYAYLQTHSRAVLSDAMESIVNIISALMSVFVTYYSIKPRDEDHPYGHGKIEFFAAAFEGGAILFAGILIFYEGLNALIEGNQLHRLEMGLIIVVIAGLINGILGFYLKKRGRKIQSLAMESSGEHLMSDFYTSAGLVLALFLVLMTGYNPLDSIVAMIVGFQLSFTGFKLFLRSSGNLMDERDRASIQKLSGLIDEHRFPGIIRVHDMRVLKSGRFHHVDMHLVVPEFWSVDEAHHKGNIFENKILENYEVQGEFNFHLDPCQKAYCAHCDYEPCPVRKEKFQKYLSHSYEELISPVEEHEKEKS